MAKGSRGGSMVDYLEEGGCFRAPEVVRLFGIGSDIAERVAL